MTFTIVLSLGQGVFAYGGWVKNYYIMLTGRVIFGLGGESMSVAQSAIVAAWFKGKELAFAYGFNMSVSRLGSVICSSTVPFLYN